MTRPVSWPGLGFDPAPGDAARVAALAQQLADAAKGLAEAHQQLEQVSSGNGQWTGEAATAFAGWVGQLPRYLSDARESMARAGTVLGDWRSVLADHQSAAQGLEQKALAVRSSLESAEQTQAQARSNPDFGLVNQTFSAQDLPAVQARVDAAQAGLDRAVATSRQLQGELQALLAQAQTLQERHADDAGRVAAGVRAADDGLAPPEPSWLEDAWNWVKEHLDDIGDVAATIASIAGILAFIPILAPIMAPIALIAGLVALTADVTDTTLRDEWKNPHRLEEIGLDALTLIPGGKYAWGVLKGGTTAMRGVTGAATVGEGFIAEAEEAAKVFTQPSRASKIKWSIAEGAVKPVTDVVGKELGLAATEIASRFNRAASRGSSIGEPQGGENDWGMGELHRAIERPDQAFRKLIEVGGML